jgi:hypothetical protein
MVNGFRSKYYLLLLLVVVVIVVVGGGGVVAVVVPVIIVVGIATCTNWTVRGLNSGTGEIFSPYNCPVRPCNNDRGTGASLPLHNNRCHLAYISATITIFYTGQ